jgi:membrane-associated phospholipid phosphatase
MRERLARLTTNLLNPFLVSLVVIVLLAFKASADTAAALKWAAISLALSVAPVFVVVVYLVRQRRLDGVFVSHRSQRHWLYLLASALAAAGCGVLWSFEAPYLLKSAFTAGLAAVVAFMVVNLFWKISLHTAFMSASVTVLVMVYGAAAAWSFLLLLPVAWARIRLKQHSLAQVVVGAVLAAGIVAGVFWGLGVV